MSFTTIERPILYDVTGGDKVRLFEPINVGGLPTFSLQFYCTGVVIAGVDAIITLKVSNSDSEIAPPDSDFRTVVGTIFPYAAILDKPGDITRYIFVGLAEGVGAVKWVCADLEVNDIAGGTIEKVILAGQIGNA